MVRWELLVALPWMEEDVDRLEAEGRSLRLNCDLANILSSSLLQPSSPIVKLKTDQSQESQSWDASESSHTLTVATMGIFDHSWVHLSGSPDNEVVASSLSMTLGEQGLQSWSCCFPAVLLCVISLQTPFLHLQMGIAFATGVLRS